MLTAGVEGVDNLDAAPSRAPWPGKRKESERELRPDSVWWRRVDSNHRSETQQIYSLPPLATRELLHMKFWSWWTDSNPRPADYKSAALPTELHQRFSSQLVHNVAYYIRQREGCQQKKQKNSKNFERAEKRPERREREHEREDFYQSAAGYAAPTGGGLVPAVPE